MTSRLRPKVYAAISVKTVVDSRHAVIFGGETPAEELTPACPVLINITIRSGSGYESGLRSTALMTENTAVFTPMPKAKSQYDRGAEARALRQRATHVPDVLAGISKPSQPFHVFRAIFGGRHITRDHGAFKSADVSFARREGAPRSRGRSLP